MDCTPAPTYASLRALHPDWFVTPPGEGAISIPSHPVEDGQVLYGDQWWMLVRDPVVFPDGKPGRYLRMISPQEPGVAVLPLLGSDVVLLEHFRHATRSWHWEIPRGGGTAGLDDKANVTKELREELGATVSELVNLGTLHPDTGILAQGVGLYAARIDMVGEVGRAEGIRRALTVSFTEAEQMAATGAITDAFSIATLFRARRIGLVETSTRVC